MTRAGMHAEILEQSDALRLLASSNREVMDLLRGQRFREVSHAVLTARGTSDNAARYAKYVWGARNRLTVALAAPSLYGPYAAPPLLADALVVAISQSGRSPDLLNVIREGRYQGRPTLAICNDPGSPLARSADLFLDLSAGEELAIAATKTYTAELAAVAMTSLAMAGEPIVRSNGDLPEAVDLVLASEDLIAETAKKIVASDRCVVLGRGYHYASAFEWALKLQEITYVLAHAYSAADFRHGPLAIVDRSIPVLIVASSGPMFESLANLASELKEHGAFVVGVSDTTMPCHEWIPIPQVEEWLAPIVVAPVIQLFTYHLARARGLDPDSPRRLSKVTETT